MKRARADRCAQGRDTINSPTYLYAYSPNKGNEYLLKARCHRHLFVAGADVTGIIRLFCCLRFSVVETVVAGNNFRGHEKRSSKLKTTPLPHQACMNRHPGSREYVCTSICHLLSTTKLQWSQANLREQVVHSKHLGLSNQEILQK